MNLFGDSLFFALIEDVKLLELIGVIQPEKPQLPVGAALITAITTLVDSGNIQLRMTYSIVMTWITDHHPHLTTLFAAVEQKSKAHYYLEPTDHEMLLLNLLPSMDE